jgi:hypothetical protein
MTTLGIPITCFYMAIFGVLSLDPSTRAFWKLPALLGYTTLLGLGWDALYIYAQTFRWDRDWPLAFQFFCTLAEGIIIFTLAAIGLLPGVTLTDGDWWRFSLHYGTVWWVTFWWLFGPMRVLFPTWRFRGGELI